MTADPYIDALTDDDKRSLLILLMQDIRGSFDAERWATGAGIPATSAAIVTSVRTWALTAMRDQPAALNGNAAVEMKR